MVDDVQDDRDRIADLRAGRIVGLRNAAHANTVHLKAVGHADHPPGSGLGLPERKFAEEPARMANACVTAHCD